MTKCRLQVSLHHDSTFSCLCNKLNSVIQGLVYDGSILLRDIVINRMSLWRGEIENNLPTGLYTIGELGSQANGGTIIIFGQFVDFYDPSFCHLIVDRIRDDSGMLVAGFVIRSTSLTMGGAHIALAGTGSCNCSERIHETFVGVLIKELCNTSCIEDIGG